MNIRWKNEWITTIETSKRSDTNQYTHTRTNVKSNIWKVVSTAQKKTHTSQYFVAQYWNKIKYDTFVQCTSASDSASVPVYVYFDKKRTTKKMKIHNMAVRV